MARRTRNIAEWALLWLGAIVPSLCFAAENNANGPNEQAFGANEVSIQEDNGALQEATPDGNDNDFFNNNGTTSVGNSTLQEQYQQFNNSQNPDINFQQNDLQDGNLTDNDYQENSQDNASPGQQSENQVESLFQNSQPSGDPIFSNEGPVNALPSDDSAPLPVADTPPTAMPTLNQFGGAPPLPGTRREMAMGEAPEEYAVELGDSLYDLCDQLLDEPNYWPKLWSMNPAVKNPHFIYPGMRLRFFPGSDTAPPFLEIVEEDEVVPVDKGPLVEEQLVAQDISWMGDPFAPRPIEVVGPEQIAVTPEILGNLDLWGRVAGDSGIVVTVPGFIREDAQSPLAIVRNSRDGEIMSVTSRHVGLEISGGALSANSVYSVVRPHGRLQDSTGSESAGYLYYYVGALRVLSVESEGKGYAVAELSDNRDGVRDGDWVVPYVSVQRTISPQNLAAQGGSEINAVIVAFENDGQTQGAHGSLAFINRGSRNGVQSGQLVQVFQVPRAWTEHGGFGSTAGKPSGVASLYIIDTTEVGAVGYITYSSREVRVGDPLTQANRG